MELELMYGNCSYLYTQFLLLHICVFVLKQGKSQAMVSDLYKQVG